MDFSKNRVLTLDQAREYLGYSKSYMYKLTAAGVLPFSKPNGKSIFFDREKLEEWMLSNANTPLEEKQTEAATYVTTNPLIQNGPDKGCAHDFKPFTNEWRKCAKCEVLRVAI